MVLRLILEVLKNKDRNFSQNLRELIKYFGYYVELKKNIRDKNIFLKDKKNKELENLLQNFSREDEFLINSIFNEKIKKQLENRKIKRKIDFTDKNDFLQVGSGVMWAKEPFQGLWTTGKAFFYMPIIPKQENKFKIEFFSIPPQNIEIGFENQIVKKTQISELNKMKIDFNIKPDDEFTVGEIFVSTGKLWLPNLILKNNESILLGVGIKSLENTSIKKDYFEDSKKHS